MRGWRVFNDVHQVRVIWRVLFVRFGGVSQAAVLATMAASVALLRLVPGAWGLAAAAAVFLTGFTVIAAAVVNLSWLDPTGTLAETTALKLLVGGIRRRHVANFDLPGL